MKKAKQCDPDDVDFSNWYDPEKGVEKTIAEVIKARAVKRLEKIYTRRANGEKNLLDVLGSDLQENASYHVISGGDIDSLSYLMYIIAQQNLDYCLLSTWCMALPDVLQFGTWLNEGKIKRLDAYVGEIFINSYPECWGNLCEILKAHGGRVCVFRNHSKVFAGTGSKFSFSVESSANINTNPRTENTIITTSEIMFRFYKDFFDGINSYDRTFDDWEKWTA